MLKQNYSYLTRPFGIELEFSTPIEEIKRLIIKSKIFNKKEIELIDNSLIHKSPPDKWVLKRDFTTESEFTTPVIRFNSLSKLKKIIKYFNDHGVKVSNNDGFHIHVYVGDISKYNILAAWLSIENIVCKCFPARRSNNIYKIDSYSFRYIRDRDKNMNILKFLQKRIPKLNLELEHHINISFENFDTFDRHTIEFRLSEGTLDIKHITKWIKFCLLFLNYAKSIDIIKFLNKQLNNIKSLYMLKHELEILEHDDVSDWLDERYNKYKKEHKGTKKV